MSGIFACGSGKLNFDKTTKLPRQLNQARTGATNKCGRKIVVFLLMGTRAEFSRELGIKVDSGEQFGISFKRTVIANKGIREILEIFWENGNTDPQEPHSCFFLLRLRR